MNMKEFTIFTITADVLVRSAESAAEVAAIVREEGYVITAIKQN